MEKEKKKFYKRKWFIALMIFFGIGIIGSALDEEDTQVSKDAVAVEQEKPEEEIKEEPVEEPAKEEEPKKEEPKKEEPKEEAPEVVISSTELSQAYNDNEIKANKDYEGKLAEITGEVTDIGEILGQTFIVLTSGDDFNFTQIQCFFKDDEEIEKIAKISKGDEVTVIGTIDGKSINVGVNRCKFK